MFLKKKPGNNPVTRAGYGGCLRKPQGGAGPRLRHRTGSPLVGRRPTNGRLMADQWRTALRPPIDFLAGPASAKPPVNASINSSSWICINYANTVLASWTPISSAVALQGKRLRSGIERSRKQSSRSVDSYRVFFYRVSQQDRSRRRPRGGHRFDVVIRFGGDDDDDFFKENIKRNQVEGEVGGPWCQRGRAPDTAVTKAGSRSSLKHKKHLGRA